MLIRNIPGPENPVIICTLHPIVQRPTLSLWPYHTESAFSCRDHLPRWSAPNEIPKNSQIRKFQKNVLTATPFDCINIQKHVYNTQMSATKTFRHGQILRLVSAERISNQEDLRRRLAQQRMRVTQATLSRDLHELKLVKTSEGYRAGAALPDESAALPPLTRALREFLLDIRPAENLLVLKTPPSGAQPLAAALDGAKFPEIAGTIAGDDTVLIITPTRKSRESLQKEIESHVK
jgi:transcriptional regulator of arginine metabolism